MREQTHTPGKLKADKSRINGAVSDSLWVLRAEKPVYVTTDVVAVSNTGQADAERLEACWNACASLSDPEAAIPALIAALKELLETAEGLVGQQAIPDNSFAPSFLKVRAALALVSPEEPT